MRWLLNQVIFDVLLSIDQIHNYTIESSPLNINVYEFDIILLREFLDTLTESELDSYYRHK